MKSASVPPLIQAVGLACVPIHDLPPGSVLARKPVAAAIITIAERDDGHRDVIVKCVTDAREFEWPLPVLVDDALVADAPTIITDSDGEVLTIEAASRRFFTESKLGALVMGKTRIDPVAMFGTGHAEAALCRRLGIASDSVSDADVAQSWNRHAPMAVEGVALTVAVSRLMLWAHGASFFHGLPEPFFEILLPLHTRLMDMEPDYPALKPLVSSRPFNRAGSFAEYYREYRAKRDAGDESVRWLTFEDGLSYV